MSDKYSDYKKIGELLLKRVEQLDDNCDSMRVGVSIVIQAAYALKKLSDMANKYEMKNKKLKKKNKELKKKYKNLNRLYEKSLQIHLDPEIVEEK